MTAEELRAFIKENVAMEIFGLWGSDGFCIVLKIKEADGTWTEFTEARHG